jgi:hypothetical protein
MLRRWWLCVQRMLRCCIDASTPVPERDKAQNYHCDYADDELIAAVMTWRHLLHLMPRLRTSFARRLDKAGEAQATSDLKNELYLFTLRENRGEFGYTNPAPLSFFVAAAPE